MARRTARAKQIRRLPILGAARTSLRVQRGVQHHGRCHWRFDAPPARGCCAWQRRRALLDRLPNSDTGVMVEFRNDVETVCHMTRVRQGSTVRGSRPGRGLAVKLALLVVRSRAGWAIACAWVRASGSREGERTSTYARPQAALRALLTAWARTRTCDALLPSGVSRAIERLTAVL